MKSKFFVGMLLGTMLSLLIATSSFATPVFFEINAGGYGYETSWNISQQTGGSWSEGMATGSMASHENYTFNWDLNVGNYLFTMHDTFGDGLDSGGHVKLTVDGTDLLDITGNVFGSSYSYTFNVPTAGNPVPEPATMLLFGTGLLGLVGYNRKRTQKS